MSGLSLTMKRFLNAICQRTGCGWKEIWYEYKAEAKKVGVEPTADDLFDIVEIAEGVQPPHPQKR